MKLGALEIPLRPEPVKRRRREIKVVLPADLAARVEAREKKTRVYWPELLRRQLVTVLDLLDEAEAKAAKRKRIDRASFGKEKKR